MADVPMPRDLSEEAVAAWLWAVSSIEGDPEWDDANSPSKEQAFAAARAVRALLREKVREAVDATKDATDPYCECDNSGTGGPIHLRFDATDAIVSRVLGDHPSNASGGSEPREGREEAPRA